MTSSLLTYLIETGAIYNGDDAIAAAKKEYRRLYLKQYRENERNKYSRYYLKLSNKEKSDINEYLKNKGDSRKINAKVLHDLIIERTTNTRRVYDRDMWDDLLHAINSIGTLVNQHTSKFHRNEKQVTHLVNAFIEQLSIKVLSENHIDEERLKTLLLLFQKESLKTIKQYFSIYSEAVEMLKEQHIAMRNLVEETFKQQ